MTTKPTLEDRIKGCLLGAAIGAELGWARQVHPQKFVDARAEDILNLKLEPAGPLKQHPNRINVAKLTPIIALGVRAYVNKQGRVTPEDFGKELMNDRQIARPVFNWDLLHTTQELLREGCQPRISGLGTAPAGLIVATMTAVGI